MMRNGESKPEVGESTTGGDVHVKREVLEGGRRPSQGQESDSKEHANQVPPPFSKPPPQSADDSEDDPVAHEIPVFLAKSLANQLYLLQVLNICPLAK